MKVANLNELLAARAAQTPAHRGYVFASANGAEAELSFAALRTRAHAIAATLAQTVRPGERVLVMTSPGLDFVSAFFGVLAAGAVAVPCYPPSPRGPNERLLAVTADARPVAALLDARGQRAAQQSGALPPGLRYLVVEDIALDAGAEFRAAPVESGALALLQYTSGSTAAPKGVALTHRNLLHNLGLIEEAFGMHAGSRGVIWLPPYHDMGLIGGILAPLYAGFPVVLMPPVLAFQNPLKWLELVSRHRATISGGPSFAYEACVRRISPEARAGLDLSSWELAFNGAEPIKADVLSSFACAFGPAGFRETAFYPCYGLAEATLLVSGGAAGRVPVQRGFDVRALEQGRCAAPREGARARTLVGCGAARGDLRVRVVDPETRRALPAGEVGEIFVQGPSVSPGYFEKPADDAFAGTVEGEPGTFLRTGDLGAWVDGELFVTGRAKEVLIQRGRKYFPQDLEQSVQRAHPRFEGQLSAVAALHENGEESLLLVQEVSAAAPAPELEEACYRAAEAVWREHQVLLERVAVVPRGAIPRTTSGKLRRREAQVRFTRGELTPLFQCKLSPEALVERVCHALLGPGARGQSLDFLAAGGDSLLAAGLLARLKEQLGVELSLRELYEAPSLAALLEKAGAQLAGGSAGAGAELAPIPRVERGAEHPISMTQERLWLVEQMGQGNAAYNVATAFRVRGALDREALERSIAALVERQEVLRTSFVSREGRSALRVSPRVSVPIRFTDLSSHPPGDEGIRTLVNAEAREAFDLSVAPLLRVAVTRLGENDHVLSLTAHHIVCDGSSMKLLGAELAVAYRAFHSGEAPGFAPLEVQYLDVAAWQRQWLSPERVSGQLAYWRSALEGANPILELPTDRPRPAVFSFRGERQYFDFEPGLARAVHRFAAAHKVTPFVVLLAALEALLHRFTGQDDFLLGTAVAGRSRTEMEPLLGFFVNTLALRARVEPGLPFSALLAQARDTATDAFAHQEVPFERVVQELQKTRDISRTPLVQVVFAYQNLKGALPELPGLRLTPIPTDARTSMFDLVVSISETDGGLTGHLEYNTDLFVPDTMTRFWGCLLRLLGDALGAPQTPVGQLALVDEKERRRLTHGLNQTAARLGPAQCIHQLVAERAAAQPEALALRYPGRDRTYAQLMADAAVVADGLRRAGVRRGDVVAIYMERSPEMIAAALGILQVGATYTPVVLSLPEARVQHVLDWLSIRHVVTQPHKRALFPRESKAGEVQRITLRWAQEGAEAALEVEEGGLPEDAPRPPSGVTSEDLAYILFTSGSTGVPKGVMVRHGPVLNVLRWVNQTYGVGPEEHLLFVNSLSFDLSVYDLFGTLSAGGKIRIATEEEIKDPALLAQVLTHEPITFWNSAPPMLQQVLPFLPAAQNGVAAGPLRIALQSGDWLPLQVPERLRRTFPGCRVVNLGGATETTVWSNFFEVKEVDPTWVSIPYGVPMPNSRYYVLDAALEPCPVGVPGDIYTGGNMLSEGYVGDSRLTAQKFIPDPFSEVPGWRMYRTGDRGRIWADGTMEFLGRLDEQVKVRGFRIELGEIRAVLAGHAAVQDCAVLVREDEPGDKRLVAYVVLKEPLAQATDVLRQYLRKALPDQMVPSALVLLPAIPVTSNGKLDRRALPAPELDRGGDAGAAATTPTQAHLVKLWSEVLGVTRVGVEDNFFDIGGNSLLLGRVYARLKDEGRALTMVDLFEQPTVAALAEHLDRAAALATPAAADPGEDRAARQREALKRRAQLKDG